MTDLHHEVAETPSPRLVAIGARLKLARERAGMSQEQVHVKCGVTIRSLTRWENGKVEPGFERLARMAELFGVSMDWIAGRTTIERCLTPGMVLVDDTALQLLEDLVALGKTARDVPERLVRRPGIHFAVVVPESPTVVASDAANAVEARMQSLWKQLKKNES